MPGKNPRPATVEDYDESVHDIVPDSQQVANTGAKVSSRLDHRFPEPLIDAASDSGYSSRTAATGNSTQSASGGKSPPTVLKQTAPKRTDLSRKSSRRERDRERKEDRAPRTDETMQMGAYPGAGYPQPHAPRSPSKSHRRDSYLRHDIYYEGNTQYHPSTPIDPRPMELPPHPSYYRPPMPDYGPQPTAFTMEEYHTSRPGRSHSSSYGPMYHQDRALGWPVASSRGYAPPQPQQQYPPHYEHGPPPVSSAWHQGSYSSSPYGPQHNFPQSEYYPQEQMYLRERSESREPSRQRRGSVYGPPPSDADIFPDFEEEAVEQYYARQPRDKPRGRAIKPSPDYYDDDHAKMPPPPPPAPSSRTRTAPQIHQPKRPEPRKIHTAAAAVPSQRRHSRALDMSDVRDALPEIEYGSRRVSREAAPLERSQSQSLRSSRRSDSYHEDARGARVAVENSARRRRPQTYYYDDRSESPAAMEDRVGEAERYQAVTAGRSTAQLPLSQETLLAKSGNGLPSDNGSQKSRSNSSRGSATKTEKENQPMTLTMNGMTIGFAEESLAGKSISIRTGDAGAMQFNITDGTTRRPKAYVQGSSYSDNTHTGGSGRRVLEDGRRARGDDRRSERSVHQSSHRSSRSTYGGRRYQI
ncbi:hypothetical protein N7520_000817 [Penicillium odoratum]|uniref:uncharacterized protein n=1 Tax=Penicillium odoratum TaxID=1167516 RepID=UPI002547DF6D|nr:uncharacterized protein N7520_000817 [Penicillium odoratum]KAJ5777571.1 hypothetical protein N7520_000817 [Penicillium odoratum]